MENLGEKCKQSLIKTYPTLGRSETFGEFSNTRETWIL